METKVCTRCLMELPVREFSPLKGMGGGRTGYVAKCKICVKMTPFGKSRLDSIQAVLDGCEICGNHDIDLEVDHCHDTNTFRGFLCHRCNWGMGIFQDDPELLQKAVDYLNSHRLTTAGD
jgi:hypothetical protein